MERRDFVKTAALSAASIATLTGCQASAKSSHSHHHGKKVALAASGYGKGALDNIYKTASDCIRTGELCINHCAQELAKGNTMLASCQMAVRNTVAACESLAKIVTINSLDKKTMKAFAMACADICQECANECKKHADHHQECKSCMESCLACIKACKALS